MRIFALLPVLLLAFSFGGCAQVGNANNTPITPADFENAIVTHERDIRTFADSTTSVSLLLTPAVDRAKTANQLHIVADAVNSAVSNNVNVTISDVDQLIKDLVSKQDMPYVSASGVLLHTVESTVLNQLNTTFANAPNDLKVKALQALLRGASLGVMDATSLYLPPAPSTQPVLPSRKKFNVTPHRVARFSPGAPVALCG